MELLINGKPLALPLDFEIELEEVNPFFSEVGSQSLPITLPYSPHNLELLGYPERIAHTFKLDNEHEAVLRHGVLQKVGRLVIFSASKESGIETNFYLNDGEFYTKIKDVHLSAINFDNPKYNPDYNPDPFTGSASQRAVSWLNRFNAVQRGEVQAPYSVFPVCTKAEEKTDDSNNKYYEYELLNEPNFAAYPPGYIPFTLLGNEERVINDVPCPVGYGVTPFLKLNFFLRILFAHFGYDLKTSIFDTDAKLSRIVILNNNADTICAGKLDYRQLLPNCNVSTFLDTIRNKFCCEFIPDSRTKTIVVQFFQNNSLSPDMDITSFVTNKPFIAHESFKQLRLTAGTSLTFAQPAAETMEELIKDYSYASAYTESEFAQINNVSFDEIFFRKATGQFYKQTSDGSTLNLQPIGSCLFNYDKQSEGLEYDERTTDDEQIPVILYKKSVSETTSYPLLLPLIGERKHLNTGIKKNNGEAKEENPEQTKIMCCFYGGIYVKIPFGTPYCYDPTGSTWSDTSLQYAGAEGLFTHFWKRYDALLRHAFRKVTCKLQMPLTDFLKFNIFTPKLLHGVPVLPINVKYTISRKGLEISEVEFRTLRLQLPYDLDAEQAIPQFNASQYYWEPKNNIEQVLIPYKDPMGYYFAVYDGYELLTTPPQPSSFDAPTEAQFINSEALQLGKFMLRVYGRIRDGYGSASIRLTFDVEYSAWLEPRKKN
jgi:hypothetical protein